MVILRADEEVKAGQRVAGEGHQGRVINQTQRFSSFVNLD